MSSPTEVARALMAHQSFLLTSHARPDGDAIGSQLALGLALEALGKTVRFIDRDPVPGPYRNFPAVDRIELTRHTDAPADAVVVLECSDLSRPGVTGLDRPVIINIDHHLGNTLYGTVNWFDLSAAACGEMVAEIIDQLGVAWTPAVASHLYLALATDTGGFRYGPMSARTFDICRRIVLAGVSPAALSREIFDNYSIGRVKLTGTLLGAMELHHDQRVVLLYIDDRMLEASGATGDDIEGLVNLPLGAREVVAVALGKRQADGTHRVSLRSKGAIDVRAVALAWAGGGHRNAAGCTISGDYALEKDRLVALLSAAVDDAGRQSD
ncbi:MAG TPA: bifunctional oligoribonuclease/PAP phosphatase NrnA [Vicinamibacterales bacterium]|nr:bifunctional oligoribonuclease/PAP phosphatase NrnA [Vicinamibacterales bacterium]